MVMCDKLSTHEAAALLGISPLTLKDWARERRIASLKIGRRVLFTQVDLEEFLTSSRRPARRLAAETGAA